MGFLAEGNTLSWEDSQEYTRIVKKEGLKQLVAILRSRGVVGPKRGDSKEPLAIIDDNAVISDTTCVTSILEDAKNADTECDSSTAAGSPSSPPRLAEGSSKTCDGSRADCGNETQKDAKNAFGDKTGCSSVLLWGDEVEMTTVVVPACMDQGPKLWLGGYDLVDTLKDQEEKDQLSRYTDLPSDLPNKHLVKESGVPLAHLSKSLDVFGIKSSWHPEMSRWMVEALPNPPPKFSGDLDGCVLGVEESMNVRRIKVQANSPANVVACTITAFPSMGGFELGTGDWLSEDMGLPGGERSSPSSRSLFIPDNVANPHPRFPTLVANVRERRGHSYQILAPVYKDRLTNASPVWKKSLPSTCRDRDLIRHNALRTPFPVKGHVYMDNFAFGMGMSCLQVTVGVPDASSGRHLYDQFAVLAPIMLSLTASTPAIRGCLLATDVRWRVLEQSVDCRTKEEEDPESPNYIPKSRYSGISRYISDNPDLEEYWDVLNDSISPELQCAYNFLREEGLDENLAKHYAYLWIRDPMVIYDNAIHMDHNTRNDHFENLNSTNWHSVRFKPPPPSEPCMPFRVEMRTPEVQLTDFENASISCITAVLARAIIENEWEFYIPMRLNDENMETSFKIDSVVQECFWWRTTVEKGSTCEGLEKGVAPWKLMTMHQIMSGDGESWVGLMPLIMNYLRSKVQSEECSQDAFKKMSVYTSFNASRASGEVPTCARYLRNIMMNHPDYNHDSIITPSMATRYIMASTLAGAGFFRNDLQSIRPHLGRYVLDVLPLYKTEECTAHDCCRLEKLRTKLHNYENDGDKCCIEKLMKPETGACGIHHASKKFLPTSPDGGWVNDLHKDEWIALHGDNSDACGANLQKGVLCSKAQTAKAADFLKSDRNQFTDSPTRFRPVQSFGEINVLRDGDIKIHSGMTSEWQKIELWREGISTDWKQNALMRRAQIEKVLRKL